MLSSMLLVNHRSDHTLQFLHDLAVKGRGLVESNLARVEDTLRTGGLHILEHLEGRERRRGRGRGGTEGEGREAIINHR